MRCRSLDGPWGSHHVDASLEKCETSDAETEEAKGMGADVSAERCLLPCTIDRPALWVDEICPAGGGDWTARNCRQDCCLTREALRKVDPRRGVAIRWMSLRDGERRGGLNGRRGGGGVAALQESRKAEA